MSHPLGCPETSRQPSRGLALFTCRARVQARGLGNLLRPLPPFGEVSFDVSLLDEAHERGVSHDGRLHPPAPHGHATDWHRLCEAAAVWRRGEDPAGE